MNTAAQTTPVTPNSTNASDANATTMQVRKRDGSLEPVDVNKIVRAVARSGSGLENIDVLKIATKTIGGLYDGATTKELDNLSIQT
ncbi:MAG: ribonucleoside-diphosphate reductase subunit alpha, partial [Elusimicrobia bacterium]|nr:ribonucleoside-diphosphate reductase subunit alpha [Elusimicrobiota bacterium]